MSLMSLKAHVLQLLSFTTDAAADLQVFMNRESSGRLTASSVPQEELF